MAIWRPPIPTALDPTSDDAADSVKDHLASQGIKAEVAIYNPPPPPPVIGGIRGGGAAVAAVPAGPPSLVIDAATDPTAALSTYTGAPSNGRARLRQARTIAFNFRDKVMANPSAFTENDRATAAAIILIEALARMD